MKMSKIRPGCALALVACLVAACGSSGSGKTASKGLVVGVFQPFSGPLAGYGVAEMAGCVPAVRLINASGGVLGHTLTCQPFDTRGDPADAVNAAHQMLASTSNLAMVLGPSTIEEPPTLPIINQAKIPMMVDSGDLAYKRGGPYDYYWRTLPADYVGGYAMALWAHREGFTRGAALFANDAAAQGNVPGIVAGFRKLGGKITANEQLAPGQSSYQTEIERALSTHPQVIFSETDPQAASVLFNNLKALGKLMPVVATSSAIDDPNQMKAIEGAIGKANVLRYITAVGPYAHTSGPAWSVFNNSLLKSGSKVKNPSQYSKDAFTAAAYDDVTIVALAMVTAKSTSPPVYNNFIPKVANPHPGAVVVHDFAAGIAALKAGKSIQYVGPTGDVAFDSTHNSPGLFAGFQPANGKVLGVLSAARVAAVLH